MRKPPWRQTIRRESGLIENVCVHGVGHPAYASADYMDKVHDQPSGTHSTHGCDGCCQTNEWKLADARKGCQEANKIIVKMMTKRRETALDVLDKMSEAADKQRRKALHDRARQHGSSHASARHPCKFAQTQRVPSAP